MFKPEKMDLSLLVFDVLILSQVYGLSWLVIVAVMIILKVSVDINFWKSFCYLFQ